MDTSGFQEIQTTIPPSMWTFLLYTISLDIIRTLAQSPSRPNIVILLADDLGIGDVGCYGNTTLQTPNIDSLASDGIKLTQHLAVESICTPSRSAFLTGRYPKRIGMDSGDFRVLFHLASPTGLPTAEVTFAEQAKSAGYETALIGKWHQGLYDIYRRPVHHPNSQGFDFFYGMPYTISTDFGDEVKSMALLIWPKMLYQTLAAGFIAMFSILLAFKMKLIGKFVSFVLFLAFVSFLMYQYSEIYLMGYFNSVLMRDKEVIEMPIRLVGLTERLAREGADFIKRQTHMRNSFLLFMSWGLTHTPMTPNRKFAGSTQHGRYGDCVEELDWGIGLILQALDEVGARNNTIVYFSSDHGGSYTDIGAHGEMDGGYNGIYRGHKGQGGVDGGIRIPGIFRWPGKIRAGQVSDVVTSQLDIFPLISTLTNSPLSRNTKIDGKDILPVLQGSMTSSPYTFLFHYCDGEVHAVRYMPEGEERVWKIAYRFPNFLPESHLSTESLHCRRARHLDPPYLFDMTSDPGEMHPIAINSNSEYKKIVNIVDEATQRHIKNIPEVKSRLKMVDISWYPHLQPCCNFPLCSCTEEKYKDVG